VFMRVITVCFQLFFMRVYSRYTMVPDLDKTWDTQNYVSKELKSGRSPNQPCNSVGLGDGVILRKTEQFPSRFSFV